jgi:hypothetical protein
VSAKQASTYWRKPDALYPLNPPTQMELIRLDNLPLFGSLVYGSHWVLSVGGMGLTMRRTNLYAAQLEMKRRLHGKKEAATNALREVGLFRPRAVVDRQRNCRGRSGVSVGREDRGYVRVEEESFGQKHRERLCSGKAVIAHWVEIEDGFVTNIPSGTDEPPVGEPWIYYMLARLVVVQKTYTMRYRYVEVLQGGTQETADEALLELVTRPGIKWLEKA